MKIKKILAVGAACAVLTGLLAVGASAHGGHGGHGCRRASYPACTVSDCTVSGNHTHDGVSYCGHTAYVSSGHHSGRHHH